MGFDSILKVGHGAFRTSDVIATASICAHSECQVGYGSAAMQIVARMAVEVSEVHDLVQTGTSDRTRRAGGVLSDTHMAAKGLFRQAVSIAL